MPRNENTVTIEGAQIIFRNFTGKEGPYNRAGDRNFAVLLSEETAEMLAKDGWNVKRTKDREDNGEILPGQPYLSVTVGYKGRPPTVVMITSRGRTHLGEDDVEMLDWADIIESDMIIRPYEWTVRGETGVKAYLKSLYVTIEEDALALKHGDIPSTSGRVRE